MDSGELEELAHRFWQAEAASTSADRDQRLRFQSGGGDLYRIEEDVEAVLLDRDQGDRFLLAVLDSQERPSEDRMVAWLGGSTIVDAIARGDSDILSRLVGKGMDPALAARIREFID